MNWSKIYGSILRLITGILGIVALQLIVASLPMMRDLPRIVPTILAVAIMTALIAVILWFGLRMRTDLPPLMPRFPDAGNMVFSLSGLAAAIVGYFAYYGVVAPELGEAYWVYSLVFLLLALLPLGMLVFFAFNNIDKLTELAQGRLTQDQMRTASAPGKPEQATPVGQTCPNCGQPYQPGDRFCIHCSKPLPAPETAAPSVRPILHPSEKTSPQATLPSTCPKCGWKVKPGEVFCGKCGQKLESKGV